MCPVPKGVLTPLAEGIKHDAEKPRISLLPQTALIEIAKVMTFGAKKYGDHNWKKGIDPQRLIDASLRHHIAHLQGEELDPETKLLHLAHAGAEIMMAIETIINNYYEER